MAAQFNVSPATVGRIWLATRRRCEWTPRRSVSSSDGHTVARQTIEEYQRTADLYIMPHIGSVTVSKLKSAVVSGWVSTIRERGSAKGTPIAARTARHAYSLLNAALRVFLKRKDR